MIKDSNGLKVSPRQKAAEVLIGRIGGHSNLDPTAKGDMTEREIALVNRQVEKIHGKIQKMLTKALGEASSEDE
jgi:hypothetical protein